MASKIFLLAIVLAAVTISECRPKASKSFSNDGIYNYKASDELNIGSYFTSKSGNVKNSDTKRDSSSSESHEHLSQLSHGAGHSNLESEYALLSKLQHKDNKQQGQWKTSQQLWRNSQSQDQQQNSEERQQQVEYQGQGYGTQSSRQHQKQYQQSSEEYDALQQSGYVQQQSGYAQQQSGYVQQQSGYAQKNGYKYQPLPQYKNQQNSEQATPVQVQISGKWKNEASWQNPNQQNSEGSPQKYSFPREALQRADSDENSSRSSSSSSSSEEFSQERYQRQAQARNQMYNKSIQQSSQQQPTEQTNPRILINSNQQKSSEESMEIQKANKIAVKHNSGELQGRNVVNVQLMRTATTSSEEGQSKATKYDGHVNAVYRN